jgi:integrase
MAWIQKLTRKDGSPSYKAYWRDPGRRVRSRTFKRRRDAQAFLRSIEHQKDVGGYIDPALGRITLGEFWEHFFRTAGPPAESTRALYEMQARVHILPRLGSHQLHAITRPAVRRFLADLQSDGVRPPTVNATYRLLRRILSVAVDEGRLPANPAARLDNLPRSRRDEMRFLTAQDVDALIDASPDRYRTLILLLAYTGLRIGEAAALRTKNVDLLHGYIRVTEASKEVNGKLILGETKTRLNRAVSLPAFLRDALRDHMAAYGAPADPDSLVFTGPSGGAIRQHAFRSRTFNPAVTRAGLDPLRVHDLRHTAVALAIQAGWHPRKIQEMLGHSSIQVTMDRYGHLFDTLHHDAADQLDALYRASRGQTPPGTNVYSLGGMAGSGSPHS